MDQNKAPDVFVVLKDGTSYGTEDGTPLCVELTENMARYRKIGLCLKYIPEARAEKELKELREKLRLANAALDELFDGPPEMWGEWFERNKKVYEGR
jgi:hypothetical protein